MCIACNLNGKIQSTVLRLLILNPVSIFRNLRTVFVKDYLAFIIKLNRSREGNILLIKGRGLGGEERALTNTRAYPVIFSLK